jgi:hypothetical protein
MEYRAIHRRRGIVHPGFGAVTGGVAFTGKMTEFATKLIRWGFVMKFEGVVDSIGVGDGHLRP